MFRRALALFMLTLALGTAAQDRLSNLRFTVTKADNAKPIRNASVVLHPVDKEGRQANSGVQLKTDAEGKASYAGIPYGKLRIQVIAPGFQTYGEDHEINQPEHEFVIRLKRPQEQHTIY